MDWLLRRLATQLDVEPARAGEAITPQLRFEQPWSQGGFLLVLIASVALISWLYHREGSAPGWYKAILATLRIGLVLLAMFMLSEAVLSVERTGLPYFVVMADDSASAGVVDQYADPKLAEAAAGLATAAGRPAVDRLAIEEGLLARDGGKLLKELQQEHKVRLYLVSSGARPLAEVDDPKAVAEALERLDAVEPTGAQSRLGDGLRQVLTELRGAPPTAVLLLSDGQTTEGEPLAKVAGELARSKGVPLFAVGLGSPEAPRDLELTDMAVDEVVFVDDQVRFQAQLQARGFAGQDVAVILKGRPEGSDPKADEELARVTVKAPPDGQPRRVEVSHRPPETGRYVYTMEVERRPRELQPENNRIARTVDVTEEKLRVLLVEGQPRYEYRYLKNFLERQGETIDLKVVLASADPEYSEQDLSALPAFPTTKEGDAGLFAFDVVLFGDVPPEALADAQQRDLVEFVTKKGGGLLFIAGQDFDPLAYKGTPLERLLPIQLAEARDPLATGEPVAGFRPELTVEGLGNPIFRLADDEAASLQVWRSLPELNWLLIAPRRQPNAAVLAEHPTLTGSDGKLPLILYQYAGAGKVMFHAFDETWLWRFRAGDRYFGRFWIQTIRFLARSKLLGAREAELVADRGRYRLNQPIRLQVRFPNAALAPASGEVTVEVQGQGQGPRKLTLHASPAAKNVFEGALNATREGRFEVRLLPPPVLEHGLPTTTFQVDPPAGEAENVAMNEPELIRATAATGGKFYTPATVGTLLEDLPAPQKVPLDTDPPIPLWNTWPVLILFVALIAAEWILRKRKQLV